MKKSITQKAAKTINFDKIVLEKLERRAVECNTTTSHIVNMLCRRIILQDAQFFRELAKEFYMKFQEANYLKEQALIEVER